MSQSSARMAADFQSRVGEERANKAACKASFACPAQTSWLSISQMTPTPSATWKTLRGLFLVAVVDPYSLPQRKDILSNTNDWINWKNKTEPFQKFATESTTDNVFWKLNTHRRERKRFVCAATLSECTEMHSHHQRSIHFEMRSEWSGTC